METIRNIAKKELQLLFYSPVAWFMLILFVVQTALIFVGKYEAFLKIMEWNKPIHGASGSLFAQGMWNAVQQSVFLYIPLLTMGLISTELNNGSIKLLYSSPITNTQIILGKFVSMVVYALILCGILTLYILVAQCTIQDFELWAVLTGWLGLFLLICTYASIGVFISSLTSYQFIAALGTFIVLAGLKLVGGLWQEYDIVRDITYWLSINGRCETFIKGMICTEDLFYFIILTVLFLALTIIRLNAVREKVPFRVTLVKNVGAITIACFLGYLSSRPMLMGYYDATSNKANTLTQTSQEIVEKLDGGLTITGYSNILDPYYPRYPFPKFIHTNRETFERYTRFKPETEVKMVYYYDTIAAPDDAKTLELLPAVWGTQKKTLWDLAKHQCEVQKLDTGMIKTPAEIRERTDLTGERTFVWEITRENGKKVWLRTFRDNMVLPSETEISVALKRLTMKLPTVAFATGHGMCEIMDTRPQGYSRIAGEKYVRNGLMNQGFDVREIDLRKGIAEDIDILTIANVRTPFDPEEERALKQYVERGGNLFILGEPRRREVMNPFLRELFGVELTEGTLVQYRFGKLPPDVVVAVLTPEAKKLSPFYGNTDLIFMPTAAGIEQVDNKGFEFIPFFKTDTTCADLQRYRENRSYSVWNELGSTNWQEHELTCNPEAGEKIKEYVTVAGLSRSVGDKEQRIVIAGDMDCISNDELLQQRSMLRNPAMISGTFGYLAYGEAPIEIVRENTTDTTARINRMSLKILRVGFVWILPLLYLGMGCFIWIRRRGR